MNRGRRRRPRGEEALERYAREHRRRGLAESTLQGRRIVVRRFLAWVGRPLARVTRADVRAFLAARQLAGVAGSTQATELACLRAVFAALLEVGHLRRDPTRDLATPPARAASPPLLLSEAQVVALFGATATPTGAGPNRRAVALRDRALLELLYAAALRASEAAELRVVDLDLAVGTLGVRRLKRGESRVLPLPRAALPRLAAYLREGRPVLARSGQDRGRLFLTRTGRPFDLNAVGLVVRAASRRAGVRAHPHAFRRALASHLVRAGASLELVRQVLGHVELENTALYVSLDRRDLHHAVRVLELEDPAR